MGGGKKGGKEKGAYGKDKGGKAGSKGAKGARAKDDWDWEPSWNWSDSWWDDAWREDDWWEGDGSWGGRGGWDEPGEGKGSRKKGGWEKAKGGGKGKRKGDWSKDAPGEGEDFAGDEAAGDDNDPASHRLSSSAASFQPSGMVGGYGGDGGGWGAPWGMAMPPALPLWREYWSEEHQQKYYYNSRTGLTQWERPAELDPPKPPEPPSGPPPAKERNGSGEGDGGRGGDKDRPPRDGDRGGKGKGGGGKDGGDKGKGQRRRPNQEGGGRRKEGGEFGPQGCNLFVFHLPDDWTDEDLHEHFTPHGNLLSAKVMKDPGTSRSRGFGFVSYDDRVSAATAIKKMQGYKIMGKRLKVEFKKGEVPDDQGADAADSEEERARKSGYPDDERLIGYLRAISAKNVVQSLRGESGADEAGEPEFAAGAAADESGGGGDDTGDKDAKDGEDN